MKQQFFKYELKKRNREQPIIYQDLKIYHTCLNYDTTSSLIKNTDRSTNKSSNFN